MVVGTITTLASKCVHFVEYWGSPFIPKNSRILDTRNQIKGKFYSVINNKKEKQNV
jgi:hypothetical protein